MNVKGAWSKGVTGKDVVITILDDGIERTHDDLKDNYVRTHYASPLLEYVEVFSLIKTTALQI